jgi:hypothetical protein
LQSTRRTIFKTNRVNDRLWVVEIAFSKTPKTVQDRHVKLSMIRRCTGVGLEKAYSLVTRWIPVILLIPLELDFSVAYRNGGRGHIQELVDQQVVPSSGRS